MPELCANMYGNVNLPGFLGSPPNIDSASARLMLSWP